MGQEPAPSLRVSRFVISGVASMVAELASYPFDTVKVHLQLQGEVRPGAASRPQLGMVSTFQNLVGNQGVPALFRGIGPAALRQLVLSGGTAALYGPARETVSFWTGQDKGSSPPFYLKLLTGMGCAALSQALASPIDVVKIRMQADARLQKKAALLNEGAVARYKNIPDAVITIFREEGGARAFSRGAVSNMQRAAVTNGMWISSYDHAREVLLSFTGDNLFTTLLASQVSSIASLVVSSPWDVVRTRLMNHQKRGGYQHAVDCLTQTVQTEGVLALYKGFVPAMARGALWSAVFFTFFESALKGLT